MSLDLAREVYWLLASRCTEGVENASIQVGLENRLFDLIITCLVVNTIRPTLQDNGIYIHLEPG